MQSFKDFYLKEDTTTFNINLGIYLDQIRHNLLDNVYSGDINFIKHIKSLKEFPEWFKDIRIEGDLILTFNNNLMSLKNTPKKCVHFIGPDTPSRLIEDFKGAENLKCNGFKFNCINIIDFTYLPKANQIVLYNVHNLFNINTQNNLFSINDTTIKNLHDFKNIHSKFIIIQNALYIENLIGLNESIRNIKLIFTSIKSLKGIPKTIQNLELDECADLVDLSGLSGLYLNTLSIKNCHRIPFNQWVNMPTINKLHYENEEEPIPYKLQLEFQRLKAIGKIGELKLVGELENYNEDDPFNI